MLSFLDCMSRIFSVGLPMAAVLGATPVADPLIQQGYTEMYNLNFGKAHQAFTLYQTQHPQDPLGPVSDAAAYLFSEFERMHILQSEFFTDDNKLKEISLRPTDPATKTQFDNDLEKTRRLAEAQMQQAGQRDNALFADTLRLGLEADYLSLIERRDLAALSACKRARELAEQLLSAQPTYYDAYIAIGVENYLLSRKPAPVRWLLHAGGAQTDKQTGIEKLQLTAEHGTYLLPYARLLLAVADLRDHDIDGARKMLAWLAERFPQNHLYREELAKIK